ncbi:hypothetical protein Vretimale_12279 [Volvox reticuliferus]|nr:hypothetical protein Vretimale_12279 [Volvox reticuliferus]
MPAAPSAGFFSQAAGSVYSLPDLSRCDCAVFLFDSTSADSWAWAQRSMLTLCGLPGCETLPVLLVSTKDDVGMNGELRERVLAACGELALPDPLPVAAVDMAAMGGAFRQILSASFLTPEAHIPDTPARKDRRRLQRRLVIGGVAVALAMLGGYCLYIMYSDGGARGAGGKEGSSAVGAKLASGGVPALAGTGDAGLAAPTVGADVVPGAAGGVVEGSSLGDRLSSFFSLPGVSFLAR